MPTTPGLRERKNAQTREAITRAALELTIEQGYEQTSVAQIAERADVSPRTVFAWFPTKDAIVFRDPDAPLRRLQEIFGAGGADTLELVERWMTGETEQGRGDVEVDELEQLRFRAIMADPYLRERLHSLFGTLEELVAESVARETGLTPGDVGPRAFAASATAMLLALVERALADGVNAERQLAQGMALLRGALDGLRSASR